MPLERIERREFAAVQIDVDDVVALCFVNVAVDAVRDAAERIEGCEHAFVVEKAGSQFEVRTRRAHRDRDRALLPARAHADLERFFGGQQIVALLRVLPVVADDRRLDRRARPPVLRNHSGWRDAARGSLADALPASMNVSRNT